MLYSSGSGGSGKPFCFTEYPSVRKSGVICIGTHLEPCKFIQITVISARVHLYQFADPAINCTSVTAKHLPLDPIGYEIKTNVHVKTIHVTYFCKCVEV